MFKLDEERPDYFTDPEPAEPQEARAGATLNFDDPDDRIDPPGAPRRRRRSHRVLMWVIIIAIVGLATAGYLRYFNPYATDSLVTGYVTSVERRGIIFKTYEAEIVTEQVIRKLDGPYPQPLTVSVPSAELARRLQEFQGTGRLVTITTERYYGMLPWRGSSTTVAVAATQQ